MTVAHIMAQESVKPLPAVRGESDDGGSNLEFDGAMDGGSDSELDGAKCAQRPTNADKIRALYIQGWLNAAPGDTCGPFLHFSGPRATGGVTREMTGVGSMALK